MESEFDKAIRLACELLPQAQAEALRLAVKAETDNFNAVLERTWASQRDLAAARDAATVALAASEARRVEAERRALPHSRVEDCYLWYDGCHCLEAIEGDRPCHSVRADKAESSLAAAVEVLRGIVALCTERRVHDHLDDLGSHDPDRCRHCRASRALASALGRGGGL